MSVGASFLAAFLGAVSLVPIQYKTVSPDTTSTSAIDRLYSQVRSLGRASCDAAIGAGTCTAGALCQRGRGDGVWRRLSNVTSVLLQLGHWSLSACPLGYQVSAHERQKFKLRFVPLPIP